MTGPVIQVAGSRPRNRRELLQRIYLNAVNDLANLVASRYDPFRTVQSTGEYTDEWFRVRRAKRLLDKVSGLTSSEK